MRAAIFHEAHAPLQVGEWPDPTPTPDDILVRVAACGLCHTDLHYIDHGVPTAKQPPLILGHEATGVVAQVGERVTNVRVNDRVLLPAVLPCGSCFACRNGRENICLRMHER